MTDLLTRLAPHQAGALWIGLLVTFFVFGDRERWLGRRNVALFAVLSLSPFLYDIRDVGLTAQAWSLRAVFVLTAVMAAFGVRLSRGPWTVWRPQVETRYLEALALLMALVATAVVLTRAPDDAGTYTNLGAQRFTETGVLPYGDPLLKGPDSPAFGASATYGPILYAVHIPTQWLLGPPRNPADARPMDPDYQRPPRRATQITTWVLFLVGLLALHRVVRTHAGSRQAWAVVAVFGASPCLVGLGGGELVIGGLRFVSHIAPMTFTLLAFLALGRPALAGALLALSAGVLYYPAFFFPVWLAYYFSRPGRGWIAFATGFGVMGLAIGLFVIHFTHAGPDESAVRLFLQSTVDHQEGTGPREYGASSFSFWTHQPGLAAVFQRPLFGETSLFKLSFLLFAAFCGVASWLARGRTPVQLAGLTAAVGAAVQLWKTHATGSYVEWYLPFLMIALFAQPPPGEQEPGAER